MDKKHTRECFLHWATELRGRLRDNFIPWAFYAKANSTSDAVSYMKKFYAAVFTKKDLLVQFLHLTLKVGKPSINTGKNFQTYRWKYVLKLYDQLLKNQEVDVDTNFLKLAQEYRKIFAFNEFELRRHFKDKGKPIRPLLNEIKKTFLKSGKVRRENFLRLILEVVGRPQPWEEMAAVRFQNYLLYKEAFRLHDELVELAKSKS